MSLRLKLLAALLPMAVALGVVGILAVATTNSLGRSAESILTENYRSVLAAQRMTDAIGRLDDAASLVLLGVRDTGIGDAKGASEQFDTELGVAEGNVTEAGERDVLSTLRRQWIAYAALFSQLATATDSAATRALYFDKLRPLSLAIEASAAELLALNQDAMVRKSARAEATAERLKTVVPLVAIAALFIGVLTSASVTTRLLQPLQMLTRTVRRIGEGEFETRANIPGGDELAQLAGNVNSMAARLHQYRHSSLGELLLAQQAAQAAIDSLPDPVVVFDVAGRVVNANDAAEGILGLHLGTGGGDPLGPLAPPVRRAVEEARTHVLSGKGPFVAGGFEHAVRIASPEGEHFFLPRATPMYGVEGAVTGTAVVLQDVTRLHRVDKLRNDVVATVAHEFRTPLTSLQMAVHLCLEHAAGPLNEKQLDLLFAARADCERLRSLVDELLDLARIQSGQIELRSEPLRPAELVADLVEAHQNLARHANVQIETQVPPDLPVISADRDRLHLALSNLVTNAIRHSPAGSPITVAVQPEKDLVRFTVTDAGPGIAANYRHRVFDRFVRVPGSPPGGAGLGLSLAREIAEAHGGQIGVDCPSHGGSVFWITIPAAGAT